MINMERYLQSKSLSRFIITFFFVLGVTFSMVAPFSVVYADGGEFAVSENGENIFLGFRFYNSYLQSFASAPNSTCYFIYVFESVDGSTYHKRCEVAICPDADYYLKGANGTNYTESLTYSDEYGFYYKVNKGIDDYIYESGNYYLINSNLSNMSTDDILEYVLPYYNGPIVDNTTLGTIEDVKYSTQINSHGDDSVDTISWYPYFDSNNNPAVGWNAQIRVVPGYYYDSDRNSLMQQAFNLFHKEEDQARLIYDDHFVQGSFSIRWGDVKTQISITSWQDLFGNFVNILDGSYWYKRGWIYQIRIYDRDHDLYSEWQDVYTVTSSSGEGVENIIDPSDGGGLPDYYNNVENSFNTTSVVNNNYDVVYYYINTPVDTNPSSDDSNEYLKEIRNNVIQIRQLISIDNKANNTPNNDNNPWRGNPAAELYDFEDSSINDFNDAVGDLPTSDLITGNKFLAASTWVRTQYETIVSNTPFEAVIVFSLLLGFGLLLIGKLR